MEDKLHFDKMLSELDARAIKVKDDYIDDCLKLTNRFQRDWQELIAKKGQITKEQQDADKLNAN